MKRLAQIVLLLFALVIAASGQQLTVGLPAGTCINGATSFDIATGTVYTCTLNAWVLDIQHVLVTRTVAGHALSSDVTISKSDVGLGSVDNTSDATKNSAAASLTNKKLGSLTSNGFVKTGSGDGTLSVDTNTYLTGNQTVTLSGDISGSGATSITTAIGAGKVTNTMLAAQAYMGTVLRSFCTGGSMSASSTVFMPGFGGVATTCTGLGTTRTSGTPVSAGTIKNLRVNLGTGGKSGDAVTVEIAGVASALTCTFGTGTSCSDTTHSAAVTAGQVLTVKVTTGASETAANIVVYFELWP